MIQSSIMSIGRSSSKSRNHPLEKYVLYEKAVQTPEVQASMFEAMYREAFHHAPRRLREDFCGTFAISSEWVKLNPDHTAIGVDLDPIPLRYGRETHLKKLKPEQRKRLSLRCESVLDTAVTPQADVIAACNFSFFVFKERKQMKEYFRHCYQSLAKNGLLILETLGGPGSIETVRERKSVRSKGKRLFTYYWDQLSFDPITHDARYAIHFSLPDGRKLKEAFVYDWRLWTIPELRDLMDEVGFDLSVVYWETSHDGDGTGEYVRMENGDNAYSWIAYVCGIKR